MSEMFRVSASGDVAAIPTRPFANEIGDLKAFVKRSPQILGEGVKVFAEEVDTGPSGRIDLLAVDLRPSGGELLLVELKDEPATIAALLQVLRYGSWLLSNPDSVRLLMERAGLGTQDIELRPRIVILAPTMESELVELTQYITAFEFDLVEVERFDEGESSILVVDRQNPTIAPLTGVRSQEEWDWERYERELGWSAENIAVGNALFAKLLEVCQSEGLPLEPRFRKNYIPFQHKGFRNVFGIEKTWARGCSIWFRAIEAPELPEVITAANSQKRWAAEYRIEYVNVPSREKANTFVESLRPYLRTAYQLVAQQ